MTENTDMNSLNIVIDTNVIISSLISKKGASYKLLSLIGSGKFEINISVPLILEYESISLEHLDLFYLEEQDITDFIDYICTIGKKCKIYYLWRPFLRDPKDDMILELALNSRSDFIVTYNKKDYNGVEIFGVDVLTAKEFLEKIGEI